MSWQIRPLTKRGSTSALARSCFAAAAVICGLAPGQAFAATVTISPGQNIQSIVNANSAGSTFILEPGTYRMQSITLKDGDVLSGQSGAILNGSELLTSFTQENVGGINYWVAEGPSAPGSLFSRCDKNFPMCEYPENLYIDGAPLLRASSIASVTSSTAYYDYSASKIYFLVNPTGHVVETSTTPIAIEQGPSNIMVEGLIVEEYATPGQRQAIGGQYAGTNWIVKNNEVRFNHGEGIRVGNGGQILNNYVHDNGELGIAVSETTTPVLVQGNEVARNNWAGFSITFEAGGIKFGDVIGLMASNNYIHDNYGIGLWCDGGCEGGTYENNTVANNANTGIHHEISHSWTITNNIVTGNGFGTWWSAWYGGAGIMIDTSDHVVVENNFLAGNYKAILMNESVRPDSPGEVLNNNYVHNNTIVTGGTNGVTGIYSSNNSSYTSEGNRFAADNYCMPASSRGFFWWMGGYQTTSQWIAYGQDTTGKWACPGVQITWPMNAATISGTVSVTAGAGDSVAITKVSFLLDGTLVKTITAAPYTYSWNTTGSSNGGHILEAEAYNASGKTSTSSVTLTVQNP